MSYTQMLLSQDEVSLMVGALREQYDRLDKELPEPSVASEEDLAKARKILLLGGLIDRLQPTHCGLHDRDEPCERCAIYAARIPGTQ